MTLRSISTSSERAEDLPQALKGCRGAFLAVGLFSGAINLLTLTGALFMLQVYDRVLPSRSLPTLIMLIALVAVLFAFQGIFEAIRMRLLVRISRTLDDQLSERAYNGVAELPLKTFSRRDSGLQPIQDLDQVRSFLSSTGPTALFDLPWMPLYLALCFAFHFWIGVSALAGAVILVLLTLATELLARKPARAAASMGSQRLVFAEASRRGAETMQAMGMRPSLTAIWSAMNTKYMDQQQTASDIAGGLGSAARVMRMLLQSGVLAVGAWLVIIQQASPGVIIASSILVARALAPVEIAIANWKGFLAARHAWRRLSEVLPLLDTRTSAIELPPPRSELSLESVSVAPPGKQALVVQDVTLKLLAGQGLGVIGPSASGKSSLAKAIVGIWGTVYGKVRVDGAALDQWTSEALGPHIGYLPQDIELFDGTVAENIARFRPDASSQAIIAAAQLAGVHELILALPEGYDTRVGESGAALSGGQRQRIALARALFGDPFLVVLDEPSSSLDAEGEMALAEAILGVRKRAGIVIVIAHRPSALAGVDQVLVLAGGRTRAHGPKDTVLRKAEPPPVWAVAKADSKA